MTLKHTVSTREYQLAHGKKPRGRGTWHFRFSVGVGHEWDEELWVARGDRYYSDAKKQAIQHAQAHGWIKIEVAP
jgi:hypothetical protein